MAEAIITFCNGVSVTSPCPMDARASLSSVMDEGNTEAVAFIGEPVDDVPSTTTELPKPSLVACLAIAS